MTRKDEAAAKRVKERQEREKWMRKNGPVRRIRRWDYLIRLLIEGRDISNITFHPDFGKTDV